MAKSRYVLNLSEDEKELLNRILEEQTESERTLLRARIMLMSDSSAEPRMSVHELAEYLNTTHTTVQTTRNEYAKGGIETAVYRKERVVSVHDRKINESVKEDIKKLAAENPPEGHKKWTLRLLCQVAEERGIVDHICHASMRKIFLEDTENGNQE